MEDQQGMQAYITRLTCYRHILDMLRRLQDTSGAHRLSSTVPKSPGPPPAPDPTTLPPSEAGEYAESVFQVRCIKNHLASETEF